MPVTGQPPSTEGIDIAPRIEVEIALDDDDPPPRNALPFDTVYVHVMPVLGSVHVAARSDRDAAMNAQSAISFFIKQNSCLRLNIAHPLSAQKKSGVPFPQLPGLPPMVSAAFRGFGFGLSASAR